MSDMISFAEQINIALDIWYVAIEIWNTLFSIYIKKEDEKQLTFTWDNNSIHIQSFFGVMLNLLLPHNIFQWGMDHLDIL